MRSSELIAALAAAVTVMTLASCGSGTGSSSAATGASDGSAGLAFAKCMRAHGLPHFPDPGGPRPSGNVISLLGAQLPASTDIRAPAFQAALSVCLKRINGGHPPPPVSAAQKAQAVQFAKCVRAHGVPDFPDPVFNNGRIGQALGPNDDPNSPALRHATLVCGQP
jgi:hypothetical protein